jgi:GT2 family glycosyltransferase
MIAELQQVYTQHDLTTQQALLIPTEHYRDTQQIRSQGYSTYHYTLGRVVPEAPLMPDATPLKPIAYAATNCIRGPRQVMLDHPLDEALPFVYEDLEWTSRLVQAGHPLYAATSVYTQHHMRTKTPAQESYIHTDSSLYHKARHRIIRVRRMASTAQLVIYYTIGLPLHTAALIYKILRYISPRHRRSRLSTLARGTRSGLTHSLVDVAPS